MKRCFPGLLLSVTALLGGLTGCLSRFDLAPLAPLPPWSENFPEDGLAGKTEHAPVIEVRPPESTVYDPKWKPFDAYVQRVIDSVDKRWSDILISKRTYPPVKSSVAVTFVLDSSGKVANIVNVDNKSSEQGARACVSAITDRPSYGAWTEAMIAMLGKQQEMTFTFYYQ